jgi:hypothetical protein
MRTPFSSFIAKTIHGRLLLTYSHKPSLSGLSLDTPSSTSVAEEYFAGFEK